MKFCGIDLHSNNSVVEVSDTEDRIVLQRGLPKTSMRAACKAAGEKVEYVHVPGCTHFSLLDDLARLHGILMRALDTLS
ncbi:hypothetical protein CIC12_23560 [Burkholderia sp. SG-MS1]|uniref:hypothetical protein n=1 Tax=Paraburkholderia sp. SG-MS1 TaxID=2023741 RepID=UPI0016B9E445|nr:hypothetical protein [Paraburkholderia sp. SG-MS1]NKJ49654.1 hypothetical protein [Paraburkholderia sp. SG-MS1]